MNYSVEELNNEFERLKTIVINNQEKIEKISKDIKNLDELKRIIEINNGIENAIRNYEQRVFDAERVNANSEQVKNILNDLKEIKNIKNNKNTLKFLKIESIQNESDEVNLIERIKENYIVEKEKTKSEKNKQQQIIQNFIKVCEEKRNSLNNQAEENKNNDISMSVNAQTLINQMKEIEKEIQSIKEYGFLTQEQHQRLRECEEKQREIASEFNSLISNQNFRSLEQNTDIKTSEEMEREYINKKTNEQNSDARNKEQKIEELIHKIREFNKIESTPTNDQLDEQETIAEETTPIQERKEDITLEQYQQVLNELERIKQDKIFDIEKYDTLNQKKEELEQKLNQKLNDFNEKIEKKQDDLKRNAEQIRNEQQNSKEDTITNKTLEDYIKEYEDIIKKIRNIAELPNKNEFLAEWAALAIKEPEIISEIKKRTDNFDEIMKNAHEKIGNTKKESKPIKDQPEKENKDSFEKVINNVISKKTTPSFYEGMDLYQSQVSDVKEMYEQEVNNEFLKAEKMLKNDKNMTLEDLRKELIKSLGKDTVEKIIDKFEKEQPIKNQLTEEKISEMNKIVQSLNNETPENNLGDNSIIDINTPLEQHNSLIINPDDRIYRQRIKANEKEINIVSGKDNEKEENQQEIQISSHEKRKAKQREAFVRESRKKEKIERKVKRRTTKDKKEKRKYNIFNKIHDFLNSSKIELENVDELEEIVKDRSR